MPIYEYQCLECEANFEKILTSASSAEVITCSQCGSVKVRKKISVTSLKLSNSTASPIPAGALSGCSSRSGFS